MTSRERAPGSGRAFYRVRTVRAVRRGRCRIIGWRRRGLIDGFRSCVRLLRIPVPVVRRRVRRRGRRIVGVIVWVIIGSPPPRIIGVSVRIGVSPIGPAPAKTESPAPTRSAPTPAPSATEAVARKAAVKPAVEGAGAMKTDPLWNAPPLRNPLSANESAPAAKPATTVKASTTAMKSAARRESPPPWPPRCAKAGSPRPKARARRFKKNCRKGFQPSDQATFASRATRTASAGGNSVSDVFWPAVQNQQQYLAPDSAGIEFLRA